MANPIPLSFAAYQRSGMPEAVTLNGYAEKNPTSQSSPLAIISRPGLEAFKTVGNGPIRGLFQKAGLFGGDVFVLSAQTLYRVTTAGAVTALTGTVAGDGPVDIDAGQDADLNSVGKIATGAKLYAFSDTLVSEDSTFNSGGGASSVCYHRQFWLAAAAGTDQIFYQVPGDTTWDALSFMSAEYASDPITAIRSRGDQLVFLGSNSTEVWALTGSTTEPFIAPYGGLVFDFGCRARASAVTIQGSLVWVDSNCQVRLFEGGDARIISDNGLSEQIRKCSADDLRGSFFLLDGHVFYTLKLGAAATWVYDLSTQFWAKFSSLGYDYWRTFLFASAGDDCFAADAITNQIYRLNPDVLTDAGVTFPVEFSVFAELRSGVAACANMQLACDVGNAPRSGQGSSPVISMKVSDDQGKTFGRWRERPLGQTGQTHTRVRWNSLGQITSPFGRIFRVRVSDPVGRRFYAAAMNV